jgi:VanZ family protein
LGEPSIGRSVGASLAGAWLPVLAYLGVIFWLSSIPHLAPPVQFPNADKVCHLLEYGGLGVLLARALRRATRLRWPAAVAVATIILGSLAGAADERSQLNVPGRECSVYDWMADTVGAALGPLVYAGLLRSRWPWL